MFSFLKRLPQLRGFLLFDTIEVCFLDKDNLFAVHIEGDRPHDNELGANR